MGVHSGSCLQIMCHFHKDMDVGMFLDNRYSSDLGMFIKLFHLSYYQSLVLWLQLLCPQSVHLPLHCSRQCVHHARHHSRKTEGHHDPPLPPDDQVGGDDLPDRHLDPLHCPCPPANPQLNHSSHQQPQV